MKKTLALLLVLLLALPFLPARALVDGTYLARAKGFSETIPIRVRLTVRDGRIASVEAFGEGEHLDYAKDALAELPEMMVRQGTVHVDSITGVTFTCQGILDAARLTLSAAASRAPADGLFEGSATGYAPSGEVRVQVTLSGGTITQVDAEAPLDTPEIAGPALLALCQAVLEANTTSVDLVAGATVTSRAFLRAVDQALGMSGTQAPPVVELVGVSGQFSGEAEGFSNASPIRVEVTLVDGLITAIEVEARHENADYAVPAIDSLKAQAITQNTADLDAVAGATWTSQGFIRALQAALQSAGGQ